MSLIEKTTERLSSNDKVIHYLHGSTNNALKILEKTSSENLFPIQQHRPRSSSEYDSLSSSSSSIIDSLSRSDGSLESSLSDPIAHGCIISSANISPDEDLDFNIGFEQINDINGDDDDDEQHIFDKNNAGMFNSIQLTYSIFFSSSSIFSDALTLLGTSMVDEYLRQSSNSTVFNDEYEFVNDDTLTEYYNKQHRRASFLHDSTHTLCSPDPFSVYTEDNQDNEQTTGFPIRSHSLTIFPIDNQCTFVEKAPKKMVRFADMMVC
jgi:hypothetical protein